MGYAKKRINPKILNHVNRNFNQKYTKATCKAEGNYHHGNPTKKRRNGHDPREVAAGCILKVGFNQTYDSIEAYLKKVKHSKPFLMTCLVIVSSTVE